MQMQQRISRGVIALLQLPLLLLLLGVLVQRSSADVANVPNGKFNNFSINPFEGAMLNRFINFRFRQIGDPVNFTAGSWEDEMQHHEPRIFERFDWVIWRFTQGHLQGDLNSPPSSVLFRPTEGRWTAQLLGKVPPLAGSERRLLVIAGDDNSLSSVLRDMQRDLEIHYGKNRDNIDDFLRSRFSSIFFEAKDVPHEFIKTVPMGFTNFYVLQLPRGFIEERINEAKLQDPSTKKLAFAGWGKVWAFLDDKLEDRKNLAKFMNLESTQAWVTRQTLDFNDYWRALGTYKYSLCPRGNGIQAPKVFEAFVLRVVPVVTRVAAFVDLRDLGFPILIIDRWSQLTPEYLEHEYKKTFAHVNWERVLRMITIDGVWSLLMNGERYPF